MSRHFIHKSKTEHSCMAIHFLNTQSRQPVPKNLYPTENQGCTSSHDWTPCLPLEANSTHAPCLVLLAYRVMFFVFVLFPYGSMPLLGNSKNPSMCPALSLACRYPIVGTPSCGFECIRFSNRFVCLDSVACSVSATPICDQV